MSADQSKIAVTGATGQLGGRVARFLREQGQLPRLVVRDATRAPRLTGSEVVQASYEDSLAMRTALRGVQTLFLVPGNAHDRLAGHFAAVDAAIEVGVERIVYLSFLACGP